MPRLNIDLNDTSAINPYLIEDMLDAEKGDKVIDSSVLTGEMVIDVCDVTADKITALLVKFPSVEVTTAEQPEASIPQ